MAKMFWIVLYDDETMRANVRGPVIDDTVITKSTCGMQAIGKQYRCSTLPFQEQKREQVIDELVKIGYEYDSKLDW